MPYFSESSKEFQKSYFKCSRKILCGFQLIKVGSHVSVRMAQSCIWTLISVKKLRTVQGCIRPNIMATCPEALRSSRRFQLFFADTDWEDSLHPSGRQCNTVRTLRSLIRKLYAYTLHLFERQGNTV
jgi:hypothetical protein